MREPKTLDALVETFDTSIDRLAYDIASKWGTDPQEVELFADKLLGAARADADARVEKLLKRATRKH